MESREENTMTSQQPLLSSLIVHSSVNGGGGSDYEPGEVRPDSPPYLQSDRQSWSRDAPPRDLRSSRRNNGSFPSPPVRGVRPDFRQVEPRDRFNRHDRPLDWADRDRGRDNMVGYGRRVMSPPLAPEVPCPRGGAPPIRERSRSPVRGGGLQPRDYPRDLYMNRRPGGRRVVRDAF